MHFCLKVKIVIVLELRAYAYLNLRFFFKLTYHIFDIFSMFLIPKYFVLGYNIYTICDKDLYLYVYGPFAFNYYYYYYPYCTDKNEFNKPVLFKNEIIRIHVYQF